MAITDTLRRLGAIPNPDGTYTITGASGNKRIVDAEGNIRSMTDPTQTEYRITEAGNMLDLGGNALGALTSAGISTGMRYGEKGVWEVPSNPWLNNTITGASGVKRKVDAQGFVLDEAGNRMRGNKGMELSIGPGGVLREFDEAIGTVDPTGQVYLGQYQTPGQWGQPWKNTPFSPTGNPTGAVGSAVATKPTTPIVAPTTTPTTAPSAPATATPPTSATPANIPASGFGGNLRNLLSQLRNQYAPGATPITSGAVTSAYQRRLPGRR